MSITRTKKRQAWQTIVGKYEDSTLSTSVFCRENNVNITNFYYWKKKFADEALPAAGFKELTDSSIEGAGLWFDFGNGARLIIDNEFNQSTFKKLMGVLAKC